MPRQDPVLLAFNRGIISNLGLARTDIKRLAMSAQMQTNWVPRVLGPMSLRTGLGYLSQTKGNKTARHLRFVFSTDDKAIIELTDLIMRVRVSDSIISRPAVTTVVTNGTFPTDFSSWTDNDESGGVSAWISAGLVGFTGNGTAAAIRDQQVTVAGANIGVEHALKITVPRGPLTLRVGSSSGADDYISETTLGTGSHSLAFTPTGDFYIRFLSRLKRIVHLSNCTVEASGDMEVPAPWAEANLGLVRYSQSGDILFIGCGKTTDKIGYQQYKIERRATRSWSCVKYEPEDGPFLVENITPTTMTPSTLSGNGTLTASAAYFKSTHVGALFAVTSIGQTVTKSMSALNDATNGMVVTGTGTDRSFTIVIAGLTAIGAGRTVILQRSFDNAVWTAVSGKSWTADTTEAYTDGLDNQTVYYRLLLSVLGGAGTNTASLTIATGMIEGICRVTGFTSSTVVDVEIITDFGATTASDTWSEGQWSNKQGYPSSVAFYEGRINWAGKDKAVLSVSDAFYSFDSHTEGDSGPINRSIGSGPVDTINWILPLQRLILGGQGAEHSCRSNSLDEPLTPTNFNIKPASRQGSAAVQAVAIDSNGIYVGRGGFRVFGLDFDASAYDYGSQHLSQLCPKIGSPGIIRADAQRQPDTRVHFVRSDGTVAMLVFDKIENVICWVEIESDGADGLIEDVVTLPGDSDEDEDHVYYLVKRTINGSTSRALERWATEDECTGLGQLCMLADSYVTYTGTAATVITGLSHLEGEQVVVWADGADVGTQDDPSTGTTSLIYTVAGGQITLAEAASNVVVGLPYRARFKSCKLAVMMQMPRGTALTKQKTIDALGVIAVNLHPKGLKFGTEFDSTSNPLNDMPSTELGATVDPDLIRQEYDDTSFIFPGHWDPDLRLCLQAQAPRPATVLACVLEMDAAE